MVVNIPDEAPNHGYQTHSQSELDLLFFLSNQFSPDDIESIKKTFYINYGD